ncbi:MAG TPA: alpha/beta fold hydrolase [Solirubrobacteraceae bacterium]|jgi:pimeloyl-ACP methyl ester carboxylesterase|nr:alpha/beta fold hydrolase [Solirubrobacteraceae bacterium]
MMVPQLALDDVGTGEPLVLVHGIATDRSIWDLVVGELSRGRRVITPDVPGFVESEPAGDEFDLREVAGQIVAGLADEGTSGPFDLVGHSLGGGISIALAATHSQLVRRAASGAGPATEHRAAAAGAGRGARARAPGRRHRAAGAEQAPAPDHGRDLRACGPV